WVFFFFSRRRRHTRAKRDWSSDVCSSDLLDTALADRPALRTTVDGEAVVVREPHGADLDATALAVVATALADAGHQHAEVALTQIGRASCRERAERRGGGVAGSRRVATVT